MPLISAKFPPGAFEMIQIFPPLSRPKANNEYCLPNLIIKTLDKSTQTLGVSELHAKRVIKSNNNEKKGGDCCSFGQCH